MALKFTWTDDLDAVARTRVRCYANQADAIKSYAERIREDGRSKIGDYLLAERDGEAIGTTTSLSQTMWVRGASMPSQGVAWVGTVRTARRTAGAGVATQIMQLTIRRARERGQVVSALMPFRASFYEHFGYGLVEKRLEWTIPLNVLPHGDITGLRYVEPGDHDAIAQCSQRQCEAGQCDVETSAASWKNKHQFDDEGFQVVDRPDPTGPAHGWMQMIEQEVGQKRRLRVTDHAYDSIDGLKRMLHFLASQRDQFAGAVIQLPIDLPLNHLLRESQIPHRPVVHSAGYATLQTRMQVRVLDHLKFFENQKLPARAKGEVTIAVRETEGEVSRFQLRISEGRCVAKNSSASPDVECRDVEWAMIACGAIPASSLARIGVISANNPSALETLDPLSSGPAPFCGEYF